MMFTVAGRSCIIYTFIFTSPIITLSVYLISKQLLKFCKITCDFFAEKYPIIIPVWFRGKAVFNHISFGYIRKIAFPFSFSQFDSLMAITTISFANSGTHL